MTALEREVRAERRAQGLSPKCSDPSIIAFIASMLRDVPLREKKVGVKASLQGGQRNARANRRT